MHLPTNGIAAGVRLLLTAVILLPDLRTGWLETQRTQPAVWTSD